MCGKFTAMYSYRQVFDQLDAFYHATGGDGSQEGDREVTYRVMGGLPVLTFDKEMGVRCIQPMRWGFPHPNDWRRPQPIHTRSETIETTKAFASAFLDGQRGIVLMKTFNEAPDIEGPTIQHTINPDEGKPLAAAFIWQKFEIAEQPQPLFACVLVTVPASRLIATLPTDRMPAFLAPEDWGKWLGEESAAMDEVKGCLKTMEGSAWKMTREERANSKRPRQKPTASDPKGLF